MGLGVGLSCRVLAYHVQDPGSVPRTERARKERKREAGIEEGWEGRKAGKKDGRERERKKGSIRKQRILPLPFQFECLLLDFLNCSR